MNLTKECLLLSLRNVEEVLVNLMKRKDREKNPVFGLTPLPQRQLLWTQRDTKQSNMRSAVSHFFKTPKSPSLIIGMTGMEKLIS